MPVLFACFRARALCRDTRTKHTSAHTWPIHRDARSENHAIERCTRHLECAKNEASSFPIFHTHSTHHKAHIYLEYLTVCPLVRIGPPPSPAPLASVLLPPPYRNQRGEWHTRLRLRGWGCPNSSLAGQGVGESQFGRLEKKPSTLSTLWYQWFPCLSFALSLYILPLHILTIFLPNIWKVMTSPIFVLFLSLFSQTARQAFSPYRLTQTGRRRYSTL